MQVDPNPIDKWSKDDIVTWLREKKIPFHDKMLKPELYELVKKHRPPKVYVEQYVALLWYYSGVVAIYHSYICLSADLSLILWLLPMVTKYCGYRLIIVNSTQ